MGFANERLPIPADVDPEIRSIMEDCWVDKPDGRPDFYAILQRLNKVSKRITEELKKKRAVTPGGRSATPTARAAAALPHARTAESAVPEPAGSSGPRNAAF